MIGVIPFFFKGVRPFWNMGLRSQDPQPNYIDEMYIEGKKKY